MNRRIGNFSNYSAYRTRKTIEEIFTTKGEGAFRSIESEILNDLTRNEAGGVIALGGGSLLDDRNRDHVESVGRVIFLDANVDVLARRVFTSSEIRPLLKSDRR